MHQRDSGPLVHVEGWEFGIDLRDPEDVVRYAEAFKHLAAAAVTGQDAVATLGPMFDGA